MNYIKYSYNLPYLLILGKHFGDHVKFRRQMKIKTMYNLFILICMHLISQTYNIKTNKQNNIWLCSVQNNEIPGKKNILYIFAEPTYSGQPPIAASSALFHSL